MPPDSLTPDNKMPRSVFHADCNSFYASVEETFRPELRAVPMAVAGDPENRHGIILAKNELAKKYKVQTAETVWSAKRKCPGLVLVPPHHKTYGEFCERVNAIYEQYTPLVERMGVDESFLDVTGCLNPFDGDALMGIAAIWTLFSPASLYTIFIAKMIPSRRKA